MMFASDEDFREFCEWKQKREAEQAEIERLRRIKQAQRERHDDFVRNQRIDAELMTGVKNGETWGEYLRRTAAPSDLQKRYLELQQQSGIAPGSNKDDGFLKGFSGN